MMCTDRVRLARSTARSGFTLIEIMVVVLIMGLLIGFVGPAVFKQLAKAKRSTTKTRLVALQSSIEMFELDIGKPPERLIDLVRRPGQSQYYDVDDLQEWAGYLAKNATKIPVDPWKKKIQYRLTPGGKHPYELYSFGGTAGKAEPKARWISVWSD